MRLGAKNKLKLLRKAKVIAFGENEVSKDRSKRWEYMQVEGVSKSLDNVDTEYYDCSEDIGSLMEKFALETGLVKIA